MTIAIKILLLSTSFFTALIAGLFYAYSCSVNVGLNRLSDGEYLRAMQSINKAILNPWFFASFLGTLILLPICTWSIFKIETGSASFYFLLAATVIYMIAVFGVTMAGNVPLNNMLDKIDIASSTINEVKGLRARFENPWNRLHLIRTLGSVSSLLLALAAMVIRL